MRWDSITLTGHDSVVRCGNDNGVSAYDERETLSGNVLLLY